MKPQNRRSEMLYRVRSIRVMKALFVLLLFVIFLGTIATVLGYSSFVLSDWALHLFSAYRNLSMFVGGFAVFTLAPFFIGTVIQFIDLLYGTSATPEPDQK